MFGIVRNSAAGSSLRFLSHRAIGTHPEDANALQLLHQAHYDSSENAPSQKPTERIVHHGHSADVESTAQQENREPISVDVDHSTGEEVILVSWCSEEDPDNPQNWSGGKKTWVSALLFAYTFSAYIGSSVYTASESDIVEIFEVSNTVAALGLSLYIVGYGLGPMVLSPLSEIPAIGRNPPYIITYALFSVLCVPMALVNNVAGTLVLRFLLGLLASPALATVGASCGDIFNAVQMPYVIAFWGGWATLAPVRDNS